MKSYQNVTRAVIGRPWALMPEKLEEIRAVLEMKLAGQPTAWEGGSIEPFAAVNHQAANGEQIAVIPLYGVMMQRISPMAEMSGGVSTQKFKAALNEQVNNPSVRTIILDVDSPGGSVYGTDELAAAVRDAASKKNVVAVSNSLMASAAYYVASGASEIVASPSSEIGSIGVLAVHYDFSEQLSMEGVKPTLIKAGKFKAEGSQDFPLTDDALSHIQSDVDRYYEMFLKAVALGRGVTVAAVRNGFGEGRVVGAQEAVSLGMADKIATLEQTIQRFASGGRVSRGRGANAMLLQEEKPPVNALMAVACCQDGCDCCSDTICNCGGDCGCPVAMQAEDQENGFAPDESAVDRDRAALDAALAEAGALTA